MDTDFQGLKKLCHRFSFLLILLFMALLSSCSHVVTKDGPPSFYVDETKIPNAVPKPERLSKYGNMPSYVVFGKRYYTMKSSKNYQAVGVASWYGTKFDRHHTSTGERYNMLGMTAAHKTLPLPTYVEVTNLKNAKKIIVKVNDRGPFESNRLIDLSYVAAKKLGMIGHGTAMVQVKAIDPLHFRQAPSFYLASRKSNLSRVLASNRHSTYYPSHNAKAPSIDRFVYLQVGAFRNRSNAQHLQRRLTAFLSMPVKISNPAFGAKLYRVQVGPIQDTATANKLTQRLHGLGIHPNRTLA